MYHFCTNCFELFSHYCWHYFSNPLYRLSFPCEVDWTSITSTEYLTQESLWYFNSINITNIAIPTRDVVNRYKIKSGRKKRGSEELDKHTETEEEQDKNDVNCIENGVCGLVHLPYAKQETIDHFKTLPKEVQVGIYKVYELDFKLFGYSPEEYINL